MNKKEQEEYRTMLEEIIESNKQSARENALKWTLSGDTLAQREAITSDTAAASYQAALNQFNDLTTKAQDNG